MKDSPNLDLLRGFAVVLVVLSHMPDVLQWNWNTRAMGHIGVGLFFVHTTLVLLMSLDRHGPGAAPFLIRRIFRIYPLAMTTVLAMALFMWLGKHPFSLAGIVSNMLLTQHITGHESYPLQLWTLPYELQMYLVLPAIYSLTRTGRRLMCVVAVYVAGLVPALLLWGRSVDTLYAVSFVPCFLPGAIAFVLAGRVRRRLGPQALAGVALGSAFVLPPLVTAGSGEMPLLWSMCLLIGLTIPFCREVTWKPLAAAGSLLAKYSYGIYLTHVFAISLTLVGPGPWWAKWLLFFTLQSSVAALAYRAVEAPGIRLGVRLAHRFSGTPTGTAFVQQVQ